MNYRQKRELILFCQQLHVIFPQALAPERFLHAARSTDFPDSGVMKKAIAMREYPRTTPDFSLSLPLTQRPLAHPDVRKIRNWRVNEHYIRSGVQHPFWYKYLLTGYI